MMTLMMVFMIDVDEDEIYDEKKNYDESDDDNKDDSGSYVKSPMFSNSFDEDATTMTNMFMETSLKYNNGHDVVIT